MYDNLNVYLDRSDTPELVEYVTADIWTYNDLADKAKQKYLMAPMQLTLAYCQLVDPSPASLEVVRKWAREHRVICEVAEAVDPTQSAPTGD